MSPSAVVRGGRGSCGEGSRRGGGWVRGGMRTVVCRGEGSCGEQLRWWQRVGHGGHGGQGFLQTADNLSLGAVVVVKHHLS